MDGSLPSSSVSVHFEANLWLLNTWFCLGSFRLWWQNRWQTSYIVELATFANDWIFLVALREVVALVVLLCSSDNLGEKGKSFITFILSDTLFAFLISLYFPTQCLEIITIWTNTRWESSSDSVSWLTPRRLPDLCIIPGHCFLQPYFISVL